MAIDGHRLADALRSAADNPAITPAPALWSEGFCDGVRFSAALLDLAADDRLTLENIAEVLSKMTPSRS